MNKIVIYNLKRCFFIDKYNKRNFKIYVVKDFYNKNSFQHPFFFIGKLLAFKKKLKSFYNTLSTFQVSKWTYPIIHNPIQHAPRPDMSTASLCHGLLIGYGLISVVCCHFFLHLSFFYLHLHLFLFYFFIFPFISPLPSSPSYNLPQEK